jgi:glycosyltransferase involved in cell wall biosynthesis
MSQAETEIPQATQAAPAVSIIVPAYACAEYIGATLDSVFAQTFRDYEVIVVNDGSPDTAELERVLEPYRARIVYLRQENRGVSAARNAAVRTARAPLLAMLDADDLLEPDYLAVQVAAMQREPTLDVLYPDTLIFGDASEAGLTYMQVNPSEGEVTFAGLLTQRCTVTSNAIVRRTAILRAGGYDESLKRSEDFDLWVRIIKQGGRIAYHRRVLARYRRRPGSLSTNIALMNRDTLSALDKAERTLPLTATELDVLKHARARFHALLRFNEGKQSFMQGDAAAARVALAEANQFFRSRKTTVALLLLRLAPNLLLRLYRWRARRLAQTRRGVSQELQPQRSDERVILRAEVKGS